MKAYFVDSNVLIDIKKAITGEINPDKSRYHRHYKDLIELIINDEIQLLVVPTVLEEIRRGSYKDDFLTERFIQKFCVECDLDKEEIKLADELYNAYIDGDEEAVVPVFKEMKNTIKYNTKDARILAEVTVLFNSNKYDAIKFITNNIGDFINVEGIKNINREYGLKTIPFNSIVASNVKKEIR